MGGRRGPRIDYEPFGKGPGGTPTLAPWPRDTHPSQFSATIWVISDASTANQACLGSQELLALANIPNVYIKVSGLYYVQQPVSEWGYNFPWPTALPVVRAIYGAFGPHRLVWGSDFPVARRHCTYRQALEVVRRYCTFFSSAEIRMVLGENIDALLDMAGHT